MADEVIVPETAIPSLGNFNEIQTYIKRTGSTVRRNGIILVSSNTINYIFYVKKMRFTLDEIRGDYYEVYNSSNQVMFTTDQAGFDVISGGNNAVKN